MVSRDSAAATDPRVHGGSRLTLSAMISVKTPPAPSTNT